MKTQEARTAKRTDVIPTAPEGWETLTAFQTAALKIDFLNLCGISLAAVAWSAGNTPLVFAAIVGAILLRYLIWIIAPPLRRTVGNRCAGAKKTPSRVGRVTGGA